MAPKKWFQVPNDLRNQIYGLFVTTGLETWITEEKPLF